MRSLIGAFQKTATKTVSETAVEYRASPVVENHYAPDGPRAGDFAGSMQLQFCISLVRTVISLSDVSPLNKACCNRT